MYVCIYIYYLNANINIIMNTGFYNIVVVSGEKSTLQLKFINEKQMEK